MRRLNYFLLLALVLLIPACSSDDENPIPQPENEAGTLLSATLVTQTSAATLNAFITLAGVDLPEGVIQFDVSVYRIEYLTPYKGEDVIASGIVVIPEQPAAMSIVGFQHGTIVGDGEAPSELTETNIELILYQSLASTGIVTVVPDLLGYGSSRQIVHPYYVEELTTSAIYDNLIAARTFLGDQNVTLDGDLFLAGYSQGGYSAMATHKYIEENNLTDFNLVASFPAAGGYDVKGFQEHIFGLQSYEQPFYLPLLAYGYDQTYEFEADLDILFQEPYASQIPTLLDGSLGGIEINERLTTEIPDLLQADILENIDISAEYAFLVERLRENNLTDWTPQLPLYLYHGDEDTWVPYQNSVDTYNTLIANGTSPQTLTLTRLAGTDHETGLFAYAEAFLPVLLDLD
ncbi:MAG: alpha/beta fold hydrolase [Bacteroidota bacterium]